MNRQKLLVVEDDESIRTQMKWALVRDYDVYLAIDGENAMETLDRERPPVITLDLGLPPEPEGTDAGLRLLEQILRFDPSAKVIVVTGNPDRSAALEAISRGAHDFFTKPVDIEELKAILKRAFYVHTLESEYKALQRRLKTHSFGEIIGTSAVMQGVFTAIKKVSTTDVPVLITGESGTGKELVASAIHSNSVRRDRPFIPINCGAIPENLMESELFGYEKGAFTGAHAQKKGRIELANGGTLFLDEIGELPLQLQVKLLRFLQDYRLNRVGGRETIDVDIRVIAATNKDIKKLLPEGGFREDLFYRLAVVSIDLPPLKKRGEDVILIAKALLKLHTKDGAKPKTLSQEAIEALNAYDWPGNVRELENCIRRAITLSEGPSITAADIGLEPPKPAPTLFNLKAAKEEVELRLINRAISKNEGNVSKAADDLGLTRPTLYHLLKKYNISFKEA
ncbi:MAG: PEP-CTERM-box response regulator transcription factor [Deltaproteobacteria bacterium]